MRITHILLIAVVLVAFGHVLPMAEDLETKRTGKMPILPENVRVLGRSRSISFTVEANVIDRIQHIR